VSTREKLDLRIALADLFPVSPVYIRFDFLVSVFVGWGAFAVSIRSSGLTSALFLVVAALAFFRVTMFMHPIHHLPRKFKAPMVRLFNFAFGIPFLLPFFIYQDTHVAHHTPKKFATEEDPEYLPFARLPRWRIVLFLGSAFLIPILLFFRFGILSFVSWIHPRFRAYTLKKLSALSLSSRFERPLSALAPRWIGQELGASLFAWTLIGLAFAGHFSLVGHWFAVAWTCSLLNAFQFLGLHRYEGADDPEIGGASGDSVTHLGIFAPIWAPVGQRYHALHHLFPTLPYHSMGEAHRRILEPRFRTNSLQAEYRRTIVPGFWTHFRRLAGERKVKTLPDSSGLATF
jgi:fatty acid desaturase